MALPVVNVPTLEDLRLNSVWILTNVVDNTTVCAPLSHLNDPTLQKAVEANNSTALSARTNLLSVITIVAPWAYKENFENIAATTKKVSASFQRNDANFKITQSIVDNINVRLASQTNSSNMNVKMRPEWGQACKAFVNSFIPELDTANLKY